MSRIISIFWAQLWLLALLTQSALAAKPDLLLAQSWRPELNVNEYWVSEKFDGVRAYWDGKTLISRGGHSIQLPPHLLAQLPANTHLDGELWLGRGEFSTLAALIQRNDPHDPLWNKVHYLLFELPNHKGTFTQRIAALQSLIGQRPNVMVVEQFRVKDRSELDQKLTAVVKIGGEGLMLHRADALYKTGRSDDLLKLKLYDDAEAVVVGYSAGKGKYQGMVGALILERPDGRRFKVGSGLTDAQRRDPPPLGSEITYRYNGLTNSGLPRFARFWRVKPAL